MINSLLVAASENNVIGKDNRLLWHLPNDMAFFKNTTWGMPVIMGRKTYESLGGALKGRTNVIITRRKDQYAGDNSVIVAGSLDESLLLAEKATDAREVFVIGGGEIFKLAMPLAGRIYMTRVHATLEGDTFFPEIDLRQWRLVSSTSFVADERHAYSYTFETWERKRNP